MSLYKSLLFLHGHFARPEDVQSPTVEPTAQPLAELLDHLRFLGGRPMRAGHNLDLEDPFELPPIEREPVPRRPELAGCG